MQYLYAKKITLYGFCISSIYQFWESDLTLKMRKTVSISNWTIQVAYVEIAHQGKNKNRVKFRDRKRIHSHETTWFLPGIPYSILQNIFCSKWRKNSTKQIQFNWILEILSDYSITYYFKLWILEGHFL